MLNPKLRGFIFGLLLISMFGGFYYFLVVKEKEDAFDTKRFRSLETLSNNLVDRYIEFLEIQNEELDSLPQLKQGDELKNTGVIEKSLIIKYDGTELRYLPFDVLFESILPSAIFEEFVVLHEDKVIYENLENGLRESHLESITYDLNLPTIGEIDIAGKGSRYYTHAFDFSKAEKNILKKSQAEDLDQAAESELVNRAADIHASWTIIGFVSKSSFQKEVTQTDIWVVIILTIAIFVVLACLPILKLIFVGEVELIKAKDALLSLISIILGVPLIATVILALLLYGNKHSSELKDELEALNTSMEDEFDHELGLMVTELKSLGNVFEKMIVDTVKKEDLQIIKVEKRLERKGKHWYWSNDSEDSCMADMSYYQGFNEATILHVAQKNGKGDAIEIEISRPDTVQSPNDGTNDKGLNNGSQIIQYPLPDKNGYLELGARDYFKKATGQQLWDYKGDSIYLESVVSWYTGKREAVLSMWSKPIEGRPKSKRVLAMSSTMGSIFNTILPRDFQFALIDQRGKVLFHSLEKRNNNENFFEEIDAKDRAKLEAHIELYQPSNFVTSYWGRRVYAYAKPLKELPLTLVTYYPQEQTRIFISEVMSTTLTFFLLSVLFVLFLMWLTGTINRRYNSLTKIRPLVFDWLRPNQKFGLRYVFLIAFFICTIVPQLFLFIYEESLFPMSYAILVLVPSANFILLYRVLDRERQTAFRLQVVVFFLMSVVIAFLFKAYIQVGLMLIGLLIIHWLIKFTVGSKTAIVTTILTKVFNILKKLRYQYIKAQTNKDIAEKDSVDVEDYEDQSSFGNLWKKSRAFSFVYKVCMFTWIVCSFLLPVILIFLQAYSEETILWHKQEMHGYVKSYERKLNVLLNDFSVEDEDFEITVPSRDLLFYTSKLNLGDYVRESMGSVDYGSLRDDSPRDHDSFEAWFRKFIRPLLGTGSSHRAAFFSDSEINGPLQWLDHDSAPETFALQYSIDQPMAATAGIGRYEKIQLTSGFKEPDINGYVIAIAVIAFLVFLMALWLLVGVVVRSLFGFKFGEIDNKDLLRYARKMISKKSPNWCTYLIVTPATMQDQPIYLDSESDWLTNISSKSSEEGEQFNIDKGDIPKDVDKHWLSLSMSADEAVRMIKTLIHNERQGVNTVLLSHYYPSYFMQYLTSLLADKEELRFVHELQRLLANVPQCILGYNEQESDPTERLRSIMADEVAFYEPDKIGIKKGKLMVKEIQTLKNEGQLYSYYSYLWSTLTERERYVLYDISIDGFLNIKSVRAITNLIFKGILKWEDKSRLIIFRRSFRSFILTSIAKNYGRQIEKEIGKQSTWSSLSIIIYIMVLAALIFVALSEPDFFRDFDAFITVVGAIITIFPTLSSLVFKGEDRFE